jgi:4-alpha-glucanotransferase
MRTCGVLLPVSSLPSPYGIGTAGAAAKEFVRFLAESGQHLWQILPLGPTGYGDSPYQSVSAFAGNPYFIDLDTLCEEGLLRRDELEHEELGRPWAAWITPPSMSTAFRAQKAAERIRRRNRFRAFVKSQRDWLPEYALFMAIKEENGMRAFAEWPEPLRAREPEALAAAQERLAGEILFGEKLQYLFRRQWDGLPAFAKQNGIRIVGDLPIYVSPDSAELWARPELFETDGAGRMTRVAGVPPDAFSRPTALGNPLYEWEYHKKTGFPGGNAGCRPPRSFTTGSASTISAGLPVIIPCRRRKKTRNTASGRRAPGWISSGPSKRRCRGSFSSLPRISAFSRRTSGIYWKRAVSGHEGDPVRL